MGWKPMPRLINQDEILGMGPSDDRDERTLRSCFLAGVPANVAEYRDHGLEAHATVNQ